MTEERLVLAELLDAPARLDANLTSAAELRADPTTGRDQPTSPKVIATTSGPSTPPVIPCTSARAANRKLAQWRKIRTLEATVTTPVATSSRFVRSASTSAPPGT
jgi:hypothetical protein